MGLEESINSTYNSYWKAAWHDELHLYFWFFLSEFVRGALINEKLWQIL